MRNSEDLYRLLSLVNIGFPGKIQSLIDNANTTYPPYNILHESTDTIFIEMAVAGFNKNNIKVEKSGNILKVSGHSDDYNPEEIYIHRGLARRPFEKTFQLQEHWDVKQVSLSDGVLTIALEYHQPEHLKPKVFEISDKLVEHGDKKKILKG